MEVNGIRRIMTYKTAGTQGVRPVIKYSSDEKGERDYEETQSYFEDKNKNARKKYEPAGVVVPQRAYIPAGYTFLKNQIQTINQNKQVEEYDFLAKDNIATVCFNFIITLRMHGKSFSDPNDVFVIKRKSDFFNDYGEKLINLACEREEKRIGEFLGMDEIMAVKKKIYTLLYEFLNSGDYYLDDLILDYSAEWKILVNEIDPININEIKEFKVISVKENFFVKLLKEKILNKQMKPSDEELFEKLDNFL